MNNEQRILNLLESVVTDIAEIKTDIAQLKADVAQLKTDVAHLTDRVDSIETRLEHAEGYLEAIKADVVTLTYETDPLVRMVAERVERMDERIQIFTVFEDTVASHNERLCILEEALKRYA